MARPIRATGLRRSLSAASISCPRPHVHCALVSALIREDGMGCHCTSVPVRVLLLNQELFYTTPLVSLLWDIGERAVPYGVGWGGAGSKSL